MVLTALIREEINIPEDVEVTINKEVQVKGPQGYLSRKFNHPHISINQEDAKIIIEASFPKKNDKAILGTFKSHINNMITGVTDGFKYKMKIVYAHFPMTVKVTGDKITIDNFLGEKYPRKAKIVGDTQVKIKGEEVEITGINKEDVGQTMANLEKTTKVKGRDPRVFQDGIYLTSKG